MHGRFDLEDLEYSIRFLKQLKGNGPDIKWALYMRPGNHSAELFALLAATGAYLVTLSADTFMRDHTYLSPVFYNRISSAELGDIINSDKLFRVAGAERAVNYQFDTRRQLNIKNITEV